MKIKKITILLLVLAFVFTSTVPVAFAEDTAGNTTLKPGDQIDVTFYDDTDPYDDYCDEVIFTSNSKPISGIVIGDVTTDEYGTAYQVPWGTDEGPSFTYNNQTIGFSETWNYILNKLDLAMARGREVLYNTSVIIPGNTIPEDAFEDDVTEDTSEETIVDPHQGELVDIVFEDEENTGTPEECDSVSFSVDGKPVNGIVISGITTDANGTAYNVPWAWENNVEFEYDGVIHTLPETFEDVLNGMTTGRGSTKYETLYAIPDEIKDDEQAEEITDANVEDSEDDIDYDSANAASTLSLVPLDSEPEDNDLAGEEAFDEDDGSLYDATANDTSTSIRIKTKSGLDITLSSKANKIYLKINAMGKEDSWLTLKDTANNNVIWNKEKINSWFQTDYAIGGAMLTATITMAKSGTFTASEKLKVSGTCKVFTNKDDVKKFATDRAFKGYDRTYVLCKEKMGKKFTVKPNYYYEMSILCFEKDIESCAGPKSLRPFTVSTKSINYKKTKYYSTYICHSVTKKQKSDYDKAKAWVKAAAKACDKGNVKDTVKKTSEYIADNAKYDTAAANNDKAWSKSTNKRLHRHLYTAYSIYGIALPKKTSKKMAVCLGYAQATNDILKTCGIKSIVVGGEDHAWNLVKRKNKWYHVDVCNYDANRYDKDYQKAFPKDKTPFLMKGSKYMNSWGIKIEGKTTRQNTPGFKYKNYKNKIPKYGLKL